MKNNKDLENELEKNINGILKGLENIRDKMQNEMKKIKDFEIKVTKSGVYLDGDLCSILAGLAGICSSIIYGEPSKNANKEMLKTQIRKAVEDGINNNLLVKGD